MILFFLDDARYVGIDMMSASTGQRAINKSPVAKSLLKWLGWGIVQCPPLHPL